jgi:CO/xanthine dehydrogenase FAD-binding subunit
VEAVSLERGARRIEADAFFVGSDRNALQDDELIAATWFPAARGPQQFAKVGRRNAMVIIPLCSFALSLDRKERRVGAGVGGIGTAPNRAPDAEAFLADMLEDRSLWDSGEPLPESAVARFGELVAAAARPVDDIRASAAYRHHALSVLARRSLSWSQIRSAA